ncbi:MAG: MBL fold metallo-hydrolase [Tepidisphaeraceae bacterium]
MRIQFCGANRTVTGSCHLLEINGLRVFLDMGMYQGPREEARRINQHLPEDAHTVDAIILSHGHLDHCGKLPVVVRAGFKGPIYCTPATADVARIVLLDAGEIQEEDADYLNRRSRDPAAPRVEPLFRVVDAQAVLKQFRRVKYGVKTDLGNGVSFTFRDAGHIIGSAYVVLEWQEAGRSRSMLFTADIGRYDTPILRDPEPLTGAFDHVITESTYGNRVHAPVTEIGPQLLDAVKHCIERKSRLLVPSFAVGRTQTILWYMHKFMNEGAIPRIPIFIDSPMGVEVTRMTTNHSDLYDEETKKLLRETTSHSVVLATSSAQSREINAQAGPCVIIASSPTCEFGRILHHLKLSVERENDLIIFVGWTPHGTLGRRLQEGQRKVRIYDRWYELKCQVRTIHGLSAHADSEELLRFLGPTLKPGTTAHVVHGEPDEAEGFARRMLAKGVGQALVPAIESSVIAISADVPATSAQPAENVARTDND